MKRIFLYTIDLYRKYLSGAKSSPCCRFTPSCSNYAYTAIEEWGVTVGLVLAVARILRCNPLFPGGVDRIPLRGKKRYSGEGYKIYYSIPCGSEELSAVKGYAVRRKTRRKSKFYVPGRSTRAPKNLYMIYLTRGIEKKIRNRTERNN